VEREQGKQGAQVEQGEQGERAKRNGKARGMRHVYTIFIHVHNEYLFE
jgi:hypothetical protein